MRGKGLLAPQNTFLDTIATRFDGTHSNFVLGNAQVPPSFPIVYCSDGFCELSGYPRARIMQKGCACKFFYGPETDSSGKKEIENALKEKVELTQLEIRFYKKNGTPFWCLLDIVPIKNEKSEVVLFLASHKDITSTHNQFTGINSLSVPGVGGLISSISRSSSISSELSLAVEDDDNEKTDCNSSDIGLSAPMSLLDPGAPTNYNYGERRRSRAILYQLSATYSGNKEGLGDSSSHPNHHKNKMSLHSKLTGTQSLLSPPTTNIQPLPEYKTAVAHKPRWIVSHYGALKTCWDILVLIATIYVAISVPLNASFHGQTCCYHGNSSFISSLDSSENRISQTSEDVYLINTFNNTGNSKIRNSSSLKTSTLSNQLRRKRSQLPKVSFNTIKDASNKSYFMSFRTKRSQQFVSSTSEKPPVVRNQTMCGESHLWEEEMCTGDGWNCGEKKNSIVTDVLVEAIFICDILLNFRTSFVNKKGEVVSDPKSIAVNYMRGWFLLDLVAALPFDLVYATEVHSARNIKNSGVPINLLKLTRLLRLARLLQKMDRYSQYSMVILTLLMMTFALLAHWLACIWFVIGQAEQPDYSDPTWPGWLNLLAIRIGEPRNLGNDVCVGGVCVPNGGCVSYQDAYVTALYYSCTSLTTVGFGNVSANTKWERVFSVVIMLIGENLYGILDTLKGSLAYPKRICVIYTKGRTMKKHALMHATIFGNVTALVQRLYGTRKSDHQVKWKNLKDFAILHSLPKQLKQRMEDYFQTMWSLNHGIDPMEILQDFPEELRGDVSMHLHNEILGLPIFDTATEGCKKLLSIKIRTNFCAPDEFLVHKGDAVQTIYYLRNGSMEVLCDGMVVAILGKGDLIGCDINKHLIAQSTSVVVPGVPIPGSGTAGKHERRASIGLGISEVVVKSNADVRALTYCDLKCLSIPGFLEVLRLYPEFKETFSREIIHDLTYNLRDDFEADSPEESEEESHSRNVSRKSSLRSIPESEEEQEEDSTKSENEDTYKKPKRVNSEHASDTSLDVFLPVKKAPRIPLTPPVVQILSPGATTPTKSFPTDTQVSKSSKTNNGNEAVDSLRTDISSLNEKLNLVLKHINDEEPSGPNEMLNQTKRKHVMENKETQTDFPAAMLEEYILTNRRRVLKLLKYPQGGGGKIFKDLNQSKGNDELKSNPHSLHTSPPNRYQTRLGLCENLSSSAECLTPPSHQKKNTFHHQLSQPSSGPSNILDSSNLAHNRLQCSNKNVPRSTYSYTKSIDSEDLDTINFQPILQKPPRNLSLSGYSGENDQVNEKEDKGNKKNSNGKPNHVRFASDGGTPLAQTRRPTSCLSLDLCSDHSQSIILPIHEEEDGLSKGSHPTFQDKNKLKPLQPKPKPSNQHLMPVKSNATKLSKAVLLKRFRSSDDCSMPEGICPNDVADTISTIIQPASSTVSLDVTKCKEPFGFTNYHVTCETKTKKDSVVQTKPENDDKRKSTTITDF